KGNSINFFDNVPSSNYSNILNNSSSVTGSDLIALKGHEGSAAFVEIFKIESAADDLDNNGIHDNLDELRDGRIINDAILTFYVKDFGQKNSNRIYVYDAINNDIVSDYLSD